MGRNWPDPPKRRSPADSGNSKGGCGCPMQKAVQSARRGKYRLARRYAVMGARLMARRAFAW